MFQAVRWLLKYNSYLVMPSDQLISTCTATTGNGTCMQHPAHWGLMQWYIFQDGILVFDPLIMMRIKSYAASMVQCILL